MIEQGQQFHSVLPPDDVESRAPDIEPANEAEIIKGAEKPYITIGENSVSYLGVEVPKGHGDRLVPSDAEFKEEYFYLEGHYIVMREVATALLLNKPILLEGGTGVYNKTTTIARMCRDLNMNYCKVNFDRETAREDIIGGQTLKVDENGRESLEWYDGDLMYAIRNGGVAFLDEYNRQGKLAGIINPIMDAILNGRKEITNPYNENERVLVHPDFRLVAAQNPPGMEEGHEYSDRSQLPAETLGRWIYRKLPIEYTEDEENKLLAGVIGELVDLDLPDEEFRSTGEGLPVKELAHIPGMVHWRREIIGIIRQLEEKSSGAKREMAKAQRQNLYFNPRLIMGTIPHYIAHFYNGDINETVKNAFETCVIGMYSSEEDRQKIRLLLDTAQYRPPVESARRTLAEQEQTTELEETDLRARVDEEIAAIMDSADIPDSAKEALKTAPLAELSPDILKQLEDAKEKFGDDFLGPDEIKAAFGSAVEIEEVPAIPFSTEELEKAKELGQMLILRQPLTMKQIGEALSDKVKDEGKVFYDTDWYKEEKFYTEDPAKAGWALVSKEVVPNSTNNNYLEQTQVLVNYLKNEVFKDVEMPSEYEEAIEEFEREKDGIEAIVSSSVESEWKEATQRLEALKINQLTRQSPAEALYDLVVYFQNNDERLLSNIYSWTNRRSSGGHLVYVGIFKSDGVLVYRFGPVYSYSLLGVSFSRSQ